MTIDVLNISKEWISEQKKIGSNVPTLKYISSLSVSAVAVRTEQCEEV